MTKYFILKDGEIFGTISARSEEEARKTCEEVGGDSIIKK
jgi:hypothetical protein